MTNLLFLLLFLLVGYILQQLLSKNYQLLLTKYLNKFVINISLPALVFVYMVDLQIDITILLPIITAWSTFLLATLIVLILSKVLQFSKSITIALIMTTGFGNSSFLGIPFTKAFFGTKGIPYAIVYDQIGSFLILSTIGIIILTTYSSKENSLVSSIVKVVTFPSFIVMVLAIVLNSNYIPEDILNILKVIASTLTPVALIVIGLYLNLKIEFAHKVPFTLALLIKLIIIPFIVLIFFALLELDSLSAKVSIFESAMAPMVSSSMLAIMYNIEKRLIASILGYGIIFSFATLPLFYTVIK